MMQINRVATGTAEVRSAPHTNTRLLEATIKIGEVHCFVKYKIGCDAACSLMRHHWISRIAKSDLRVVVRQAADADKLPQIHSKISELSPRTTKEESP